MGASSQHLRTGSLVVDTAAVTRWYAVSGLRLSTTRTERVDDLTSPPDCRRTRYGLQVLRFDCSERRPHTVFSTRRAQETVTDAGRRRLGEVNGLTSYYGGSQVLAKPRQPSQALERVQQLGLIGVADRYLNGWSLAVALVATLGLVQGCCDRGSRPDPPYGPADDTSSYSSGDYQSVSYTYYCLSGQYVSVDYVSTDGCDKWHEDSRYTSDGICRESLSSSRSLALERFGTLWPASSAPFDSARVPGAMDSEPGLITRP